LVLELSDDKNLHWRERKELQVKTAAKRSDRVKILKLADKTANLWSLAKSPPTSWDADRRRQYLAWSTDVVAGLRGVNPALEAEFDRAAESARLAVGAEPDRTRVPA